MVHANGLNWHSNSHVCRVSFPISEMSLQLSETQTQNLHFNYHSQTFLSVGVLLTHMLPTLSVEIFCITFSLICICLPTDLICDIPCAQVGHLETWACSFIYLIPVSCFAFPPWLGTCSERGSKFYGSWCIKISHGVHVTAYNKPNNNFHIYKITYYTQEKYIW